MHTIDLLKGQGVPPKTTLKGVFFMALVFILPLIGGSLLVVMYAVNKINIETQIVKADKLKDEIKNYLPDKQKVEELQSQKNYYNVRVLEASKCIDTYFQWSPILIQLVRNMPEDMVMDKLSVENISAVTLKKKKEPDEELVIPIPQKKMVVDLSGLNGDAYNIKVQEYQEKLKSEQSLVSLLKDVTYIKQAIILNKPEESFRMNFVFDKNNK